MCVSSSSREENFYKINKVTIVVAIEPWIMHNIIFVIDKHLFYHSSYPHYKKVCLLDCLATNSHIGYNNYDLGKYTDLYCGQTIILDYRGDFRGPIK